MSDKIIDSLRLSDKPHLYLLNIGLSKEDYKLTSKIPSDEKRQLVKKVLDNASDEEVLKIINDLLRLELSVETSDPIRSGNRLIGQLLFGYIAKVEQERFRHFYDNDMRVNGKSLSDYDISDKVKQVWALIKNAAQTVLGADPYQEFLQKGFKIIPAFYYQQLLPEITPEQFMQGVRPVEFTRNEPVLIAFNQKLNSDVNVPVVPENNDIRANLESIKTHIMSTEWKVGDYWLFKGGVMHGDKRVPHRVNDILNLIEQVNKNQLDPKTAYEQIVEKAKEAIDNPRRGRFSSTTQFYADIFNHHILAQEYQLNRPESTGPRDPLI